MNSFLGDEHHKEYFECICDSSEHVFRLAWFDDEPDEVYVDTPLINGSFWHRLTAGVRYIFGHKSRYGHFDEFVLNPQRVRTMRDSLNKFLALNEEFEKTQK